MGRNLVDVNCSMCGKPLQRRRSELRPRSFCNSSCRNAYDRGGVIINDELKQAVLEMYDDGVRIESIMECFCISDWTLYEIVNPGTTRRRIP